eukprot:gb/GFBE01041628.1/.p1 GENE.gb/GFBE01041628.1/~~gb/GFBE01041628.1/.p1  ORF type:complete len:342 (+),score=46.12 gb/GFBE01041628.1/:1-1026(+)
MVFDPAVFHQHDSHWSHQAHPGFAGDAPSAGHWRNEHAPHVSDADRDPGPHIYPAPVRPRLRAGAAARGQEGPWFLGPQVHPDAALIKLREPLQPDTQPAVEKHAEEQQLNHAQLAAGQAQKAAQPSSKTAADGCAAGLGWQQKPDAMQSIRHTVSYAFRNGQHEMHESRVACSDGNCEGMSSDVMPQTGLPRIVRVRPSKHAGHRLCAGTIEGPGMIWDGIDRFAHRVADGARHFLGYPPSAPSMPRHEFLQSNIAGPVGRDEGFMQTFTYSNTNGHEEMRQIQAHCQDGTCVQRTRTYSPGSVVRPPPHQEPVERFPDVPRADSPPQAGPGTTMETVTA